LDAFWQIALSVLGGMITVALVDRLRTFDSTVRRWKLLRIFGPDAASDEGIHVVYTHLILPELKDPNGNVIMYPYRKPGNRMAAFATSRPVSSAEVRGIKHLSEALGMGSGNSTKLDTDYEVRGRLDMSFIAIGGPLSNDKTHDAIYNAGNKLVVLEERGFVSRMSGKPLLKVEAGWDYGLIMKCHPSQFPKRIWLVCAGFGEWGSSGAAWFLAYKWDQIYRRYGSKEFAVIVKVKEDQDESAEPVLWVDSEECAERLANAIS